MRIGILGGTFNPIHNGHIKLACAVRQRLKLDKVIFVPAYIPPHKSKERILSANKRYEMVKLAIKDKPYFDISDYEIRSGGTSYSVRTLRHFRKKFGKGVKLFFLTGSDSLVQLKSWRALKKIVQLADFVVVPRPGYKITKLPVPGIKRIYVPTLDISSTNIRRWIKNGLSPKGQLPKAVYAYINQKGLYK